MIIGIDIGGTGTHGVLMDRGRVVSSATLDSNRPEAAAECMERLLKTGKIPGKDMVKIALTGGGSRKVTKKMMGRDFLLVDEIKALGVGGMYLSGKRDVFVVSIGTGTALVSVKGGVVSHPGGSGIGGGTLAGLSRLALNVSVSEAERLAKKGDNRNVDLTVGDIVGGPVGRIPADATASNFGKLERNARKEDIAAGLINMVAESIGVTAFFAAKNYGLENGIIVCGRVALNGVVKERIKKTIEILGGKASVPENAEYCAAIGAAMSLE